MEWYRFLRRPWARRSENKRACPRHIGRLQGNCLWGGPRFLKCSWFVEKAAAASRDLKVIHKLSDGSSCASASELNRRYFSVRDDSCVTIHTKPKLITRPVYKVSINKQWTNEKSVWP